jgi:hypothetical protein
MLLEKFRDYVNSDNFGTEYSRGLLRRTRKRFYKRWKEEREYCISKSDQAAFEEWFEIGDELRLLARLMDIKKLRQSFKFFF